MPKKDNRKLHPEVQASHPTKYDSRPSLAKAQIEFSESPPVRYRLALRRQQRFPWICANLDAMLKQGNLYKWIGQVPAWNQLGLEQKQYHQVYHYPVHPVSRHDAPVLGLRGHSNARWKRNLAACAGAVPPLEPVLPACHWVSVILLNQKQVALLQEYWQHYRLDSVRFELDSPDQYRVQFGYVIQRAA